MEPSHSKLEQLNQAVKKALGQIMIEQFPGELITVGDVLLDQSLQAGRVWLTCSPEQLSRVEQKRGEIQAQLKDYVKTRFTPRLTFLADDHYLDSIDQLYQQVEQDDEA